MVVSRPWSVTTDSLQFCRFHDCDFKAAALCTSGSPSIDCCHRPALSSLRLCLRSPPLQALCTSASAEKSVVWNPWDKKANAMADFGDDEYKHMLCVEAAVVEKHITLKPGEEWRGRQELSAVSSSYCSGQPDPHRVLGN